jgi:hypothetical protein
MPLHLRPRIYAALSAELVDLEIGPLGLRLRGGEDLATRRPYPNRWYKVACRREGRKAIDGILIEIRSNVKELRTVARWAIEAERVVVHKVEYRITDEDFDAASDHMMLWRGVEGKWGHRIKAGTLPPVYLEPRMEIDGTDTGHRNEQRIDTIKAGWIVERSEHFLMPTIERARLLDGERSEKLPLPESAFQVG